jgi:CHAT domain-containing protein/gamma-glutamylcyclotransferase (GGCT)/AIG2-like uncharacterized protein YtfP
MIYLNNKYLFFCSLLLLFCIPAELYAQSGEELLVEAGKKYSRDQLDSSRLIYQRAFRIDDPDIQIQALGGLAKVAIREANMSETDSLIRLGDQLRAKEDIELEALCRFRIIKGEFFRSNSRFPEALEVHKGTIEKSRLLPDSLLIRANALYYTALTFERLSQYDSSLTYAQRAYPLLQQHMDTSSLSFSGITNGMGVVYYRANRIDEAEQFYLKSKTTAEKQLGPVSSDLAICLSNLSSISRAREDYQQAIAYSEQALKIFRLLEDESGISGAYYGLGVYHYFWGDYGRTKDYMEACIAIRERLYSPLHYSLIGPYEVLGIALEEAGRYEETLSFLRKVRKIIQANYPPGNITAGFNFENTAICFMKTGQLDSALHYIQLSNQILPEQLPANDYSLAVHYFSYANILYQLDRLKPSTDYLRQSSQVYDALGMSASTEYAQNIAMQGLIAAEKGDWKTADQAFERALKNIRLPGEDSLAFRETPNSLWLLNEYMDYQFGKYTATGSPFALEEFKRYAALYLDLSDRFRKRFIDPYTKSILVKDNAEVYSRNIDIYYHLYQKDKQEEYLAAAYDFSEYGRTCLLRDWQDEKISSYAGMPDSLIELEATLKKTITDLNEQVLEKPSSEQARGDLFAAKEALNQHIEKVRKKYPRYYELKYNSRAPSLEEVRTQLEAGENMVEYVQGDTAYYALLINNQNISFRWLGNRLLIDSFIRDWKRQLRGREDISLNAVARKLYQRLWAPIADKLEGDRVTIIPVGPLFYLNFETLPSASGNYLIQDFNISYALSLTILYSEEAEQAKGSILAIAPGFEDEIKQAYQDKLDSLEQADEDFLRTVRQPWSLKLAQNLKKRFTPKVFTGLGASEATVKKQLSKGKILYFGTHAIAEPEDPLRSRLVLAKEVGEQKEDGYLHAYELYGIPLQAELAVLNACESGLGSIQQGEGMISLAYSMHYAGCPSTVLSLWKVDEKISTQITESFFGYLSQGLSKSQALRQAKLDYLEQAQNLQAHPFYWGGMVLMGKDGKVEIQQANSQRNLLFTVAAVILIGLLLLLRRYGS